MQRITLQVTGMSCKSCVNSIERAVKEVGGFAVVDLKNNIVTVQYDESKLSLDVVKEVIEQQGYDIV